jgi:tRNA dimethylallyltransferase
LEAKTTKELFEELLRIDPRRAKEMVRGNGDNSDGKVSGGGESTNKRRIIRAILIARELGAVPRLRDANKSISKYSPIIIGVTVSDEELKDRIKKRLIKRLDIGMIEEAEKLHADNVINRDTATTNTGLSFERMDELGLEYRYLAKYLQGELNREQFIETLNTKIWQFARRQKTWFKRDKRIMWFMPTEVEEIKKEVNQSLG